MPQPAPPITYTHLISLFTTQLTISVHTILAARDIYPPNTFIRARAYNLPVQQSRHPGVCAWINDAVAAVEAELLKGTVARVALVIFEGLRTHVDGRLSETGDSSEASSSVTREAEGDTEASHEARPLERYVWDVSRFPMIPKRELNTPFKRSSGSSGSNGPPPAGGPETVHEIDVPPQEAQRGQFQATLRQLHSDMHEQFRGLLSRLSTTSTRLAPLPKSSECTFTLCIELKEEFDPPIGHPQPWIASEKGLQRKIIHPADDEDLGDGERSGQSGERERRDGRRIGRGSQLGGVSTTPVRTVDQGEMVFEMWIEEGKAKFER